MDDGYRGMIQFAISVKDPHFTDNKGTTGDVSNNFEVDNVNPANGLALSRTPITFPVLSNFTAIGPNDAAGTSADYGWGMRWRRGCKFILANSIVMGGQKVDCAYRKIHLLPIILRGTSAFYNSFLHATTNVVDVQTGLTIPGIPSYDVASITALTTGDYESTIVTDPATVMLTDPFNNAAPNLKPAAGSPALTGALFDFGTLSAAFFEKVSLQGCFGRNNRLDYWLERLEQVIVYKSIEIMKRRNVTFRFFMKAIFSFILWSISIWHIKGCVPERRKHFSYS